MKIGVRALFLALTLCIAAGALAQEYRLITDPAESARPAALQLLRHLADGNIDAAAAMSNTPQRRLEVLRNYQRAVGEEEFKRIFGRYFAPENRIIAEAAIGKHRLLIWDLGEAGNQLAGQYYVEADGRFVMDDMPNAERSKLQQVLESYRKKTTK